MSAPMTVTASFSLVSGGLSLSVSPTSALGGSTVTVSWTGISSPTPTDWIGLYGIGAADTAYLASVYTTGTASGQVSLVIPAALPAGTYELRLLSNDGYTRLVTSPAFTVGP
jgi:hypothetical protein